MRHHERRVWKEVEDFLYPPWYEGSGYRPDIEYTAYVRLLEEFYQHPEGMSADDKESVPDALSREQERDAVKWEKRRREALGFIKEEFPDSDFSEADVRWRLYPSTLDRLVYEGLLKQHGRRFSLTRRGSVTR